MKRGSCANLSHRTDVPISCHRGKMYQLSASPSPSHQKVGGRTETGNLRGAHHCSSPWLGFSLAVHPAPRAPRCVCGTKKLCGAEAAAGKQGVPRAGRALEPVGALGGIWPGAFSCLCSAARLAAGRWLELLLFNVFPLWQCLDGKWGRGPIKKKKKVLYSFHYRK